MKYGTYNTIDCPTEEISEAYAFLQAEFNKIGAKVRKILNPHDFGEYPSFEIDYPDDIEVIADDEDSEDISDKKQEKLNDWLTEAYKIEEEYGKKFAKWL